MNSDEKPESDPKPNIDPALLLYFDTRLSSHQQALQSRLSEDREFVRYVLGIFIKAVGIISAAVVALGVFFGIREYRDIRARIDRQVQEKLAEKVATLDADYRERTQPFVDQSIIQSYNVIFSAPRNSSKTFPRIAQQHIVRFATLLSSQATDVDTFSTLANLLSDPARDGSASDVDDTILKLMQAEGEFSWIKNSPAKLSVLTSLMINRGMFQQPAIVRNHLADSNLTSQLKKNLYLFAGYSVDHDAEAILEKRYQSSADEALWPELMFAILRLRPEDRDVNAYINTVFVDSSTDNSRDIGNVMTTFGEVAALMNSALYVDRNKGDGRFVTYSPVTARFLQAVLDGSLLEFDPDGLLVSGYRADKFFRFDASLFLEHFAVDVACKNIIKLGGLKGLANIAKTLSYDRNFGRRWLTLTTNLYSGDASITVRQNGTERELSHVDKLYINYDKDNNAVSLTWRNPAGASESGYVTNARGLEKLQYSVVWN